MRFVDWVKVIWQDNKDASYLSKRMASAVIGIPTAISFLESWGLPGFKEALPLSQFIPLPPWGWVNLLLFVALFFSVESGFKTWRKAADRLRTIEESSPRLRLDFRENDTRYLHHEAANEHLSQGIVYTGYVHLLNETESCETIKNVRLFIKDIIPFQHDKRKFKITRRHFLDSAVDLNAGLHQPIMLFRFFDAPPARDECKLEVPCYGMTDPVGSEFLMKVVATGDGVKEPARIEIRFGFLDENFFMSQES